MTHSILPLSSQTFQLNTSKELRQNPFFTQTAYRPAATRSKMLEIPWGIPVLLFTRFAWNLRSLDRSWILPELLDILLITMVPRLPTKHFLLLLAVLLLILLIGYLFLADILPEGAPGNRRPAPAPLAAPTSYPEQDFSAWEEYQNELGFRLRYPNTWEIKEERANNLETVRFVSPQAVLVDTKGAFPAYSLTVRIYQKAGYDAVLAAAKRESMSGLFPPVGQKMVNINDTECPIFNNYSSAGNAFIFSKAILEKGGRVFEFEVARSSTSPEIPGLMDTWLRSFRSEA